jgi:TPR repeat protein
LEFHAGVSPRSFNKENRHWRADGDHAMKTDTTKAAAGTSAQTSAYDAHRWARVAAELGNAEAQARVGTDLVLGKDLRWMSDSDEGLKWLNRSAQHGCYDAFLYLSMIYQGGINYPERPNGYIPQDYVEALKWLDITISRKDVKPCNMDFDFYHGGPRNPADANRDPLKERYDLLIQKMTPAQIAEAKKLAQDAKSPWHGHKSCTWLDTPEGRSFTFRIIR